MSKSNKTKFDLKLADTDPETSGTLPIQIVASGSAISIIPQGYGDCRSADGHGCPLFVELHRGCLRVVAFPNINSEDSKIIDLSGAKEDCRRDPNDLHDWTPLQRGRRFHEFMAQTNPVTGQRFRMREAAEALGVSYATFRNLVSLWCSYSDKPRRKK